MYQTHLGFKPRFSSFPIDVRKQILQEAKSPECKILDGDLKWTYRGAGCQYRVPHSDHWGLTIKGSGWLKIFVGNHVRVLQQSSQPRRYKGHIGKVEKVHEDGSRDGVEHTRYEIRMQDGEVLTAYDGEVEKQQVPATDFASLDGISWLGGDVMDAFAACMARALKFGHSKMPPTTIPPQKAEFWFACQHLWPKIKLDESEKMLIDNVGLKFCGGLWGVFKEKKIEISLVFLVHQTLFYN